MQGAAIPLTAPAGILQETWDCAKLGYDLLLAKIAGNTAEVQRLHGVLTWSTCDENWARALTSYLGYYGPNGKLKTIPLHPSRTNWPEGAAAAGWSKGRASLIGAPERMSRSIC